MCQHVQKKIPHKNRVYLKKPQNITRKISFFDHYHDAIGWSNLWEIHNPSIDIDGGLVLARKAQRHFEKAKVQRGYHQALGFLFLLKAIKEGVIQKKDKKFIENLTNANHYFAKCGQSRYVNLTAGTILLIQASKLTSDKSKELLKKSAEILKTIDEKTYHLALYRYYRIEAYDNFENDEYGVECYQKAVEHIEAWLKSFEIVQNQKSTVLLGIDFNLVKSFYRAEAYNLKGKIEREPSKRKRHFQSAIIEYEEIIKANFWPSKAWWAKGWVYMFLFEFDKAHEAFSKAYELKPNEKSIERDIEFATDQLKKGFHDLKQMYREESRFSKKLQQLLSDQISQPSSVLAVNDKVQPGQEFYQRGLSYIQKAGLVIEENYPGHTEKDEEGLRDEIIQCLKMLDVNVFAESKKSKGKRDIAIKDINSDKELVAECLVWNGVKYYESKKHQLFDRYLTWHNKEAVLLTFIRKKEFIGVLKKAEKAITTLSSIVEGSFQDLSSEGHKLYISEHKHKSGVTIRIYHVFFHLPKG